MLTSQNRQTCLQIVPLDGAAGCGNWVFLYGQPITLLSRNVKPFQNDFDPFFMDTVWCQFNFVENNQMLSSSLLYKD